jgi:hypothetical protein
MENCAARVAAVSAYLWRQFSSHRLTDAQCYHDVLQTLSTCLAGRSISYPKFRAEADTVAHYEPVERHLRELHSGTQQFSRKERQAREDEETRVLNRLKNEDTAAPKTQGSFVIEVYGSAAYGSASLDSDLDVGLLLPDSNAQPWARVFAIDILAYLIPALRPSFEVEPLFTTRVPILRLRCRRSHIRLDVSIGDRYNPFKTGTMSTLPLFVMGVCPLHSLST